MLPRFQRLNAREFAVVFENSQVLRHPLLQLRLYKAMQEPQDKGKSPRRGLQRSSRETRAAFVAPKKLGNAVVRNAIRRRVRERYRILRVRASNSQQLDSKQSSSYQWYAALENCDLVFMATANCREATIEQIDESLSQLLKRAGQKAATATRQEIEDHSTVVS